MDETELSAALGALIVAYEAKLAESMSPSGVRADMDLMLARGVLSGVSSDREGELRVACLHLRDLLGLAEDEAIPMDGAQAGQDVLDDLLALPDAQPAPDANPNPSSMRGKGEPRGARVLRDPNSALAKQQRGEKA